MAGPASANPNSTTAIVIRGEPSHAQTLLACVVWRHGQKNGSRGQWVHYDEQRPGGQQGV